MRRQQRVQGRRCPRRARWVQSEPESSICSGARKCPKCLHCHCESSPSQSSAVLYLCQPMHQNTRSFTNALPNPWSNATSTFFSFPIIQFRCGAPTENQMTAGTAGTTTLTAAQCTTTQGGSGSTAWCQHAPTRWWRRWTTWSTGVAPTELQR